MRLNLSIGQMGLILVAIPLVTQILSLGVLVLARQDSRQAQQMAIHSNEILSRTELCHRVLIEAQTEMRGYLLTGHDVFRSRYLAIRDKILSTLSSLHALVDDNQSQLKKVEELERVSIGFVDWMDETVKMMRLGNMKEIRLRTQSLAGLGYLNQVRARLDDFLKEEMLLDEERAANLKSAAFWQDMALIAGGLLNLCSCGLLLFGFRRYIGSRLRVLTDNTRRLAEGKELAPQLAGRDELAGLDRHFHQMAETIRLKEQENELFVYSVSHDLRAPLVNLQGFSQELALVTRDLRGIIEAGDLAEPVKQRARRLLDRDAHEAIHFIQTAVTRLAAIIDAVLRLSRAGRVTYRPQTVDVRATVRHVLDSLHGSMSRRGTEVVLGDLPPCWGDPVALDQVFANLLGNALTYLDPKRPGRIEVGCLPADATASAGLAGPATRTYYVKDNGLGIPEAQQVKVFVAFQRLHPEVAPGEGIGMALVRRVVERHGGRIWLTSQEGVGTTFFLTLPTESMTLPGGPMPIDQSNARTGATSLATERKLP